MTARELLRAVAIDVDLVAGFEGVNGRERRARAAALRALADRFDAEDVRVFREDLDNGVGESCCAKLLARLDASPIAPPGEPLVSQLGEPICVCGEAEQDHVAGNCQDEGKFDQALSPRPSDEVLRVPGNHSGWGVSCHWSGCAFRTPEFTKKWPAREVIVEHIKTVHPHPAPPGEPTCKTCRGTREIVTYSMRLPETYGDLSLVGQGHGRPARAYVNGVERPELVREERKPCPDCAASPEVPRCAEWCGQMPSPNDGRRSSTVAVYERGRYFDSHACADAGRPLHPAQPGGSR